MRENLKQFAIAAITLFMLTGSALAAPASEKNVAPAQPALKSAVKSGTPVLQNIRYSQTLEKIRVVFDVTELPKVAAELKENPDQLVIELAGTINQTPAANLAFKDPFISGLKVADGEDGKLRAVIDLKGPVTYKVFVLNGPTRIVVDIIKELEQKTEKQVVPGVKYTSYYRYTPAGPIRAHIADVGAGDYAVVPLLSNDAIAGLECLSGMAARNNAVVAVNASYFSPNGEILGLLKMDGVFVSTSEVERTALGITPDGKYMIDRIDYNGSIALPDGHTVTITGINHERGEDDLVLYNRYYQDSTATNEYGMEYVIEKGQVTAINHNNTVIPADGVVLSAHGTMEKALAGLKVGDTIKITQTAGTAWDKTIAIIGAGPRLVKNGGVWVTGQEEVFPGDITRGRAPRTAVGVTKEGHILMVVVDGRQQHSIGMTLQELAAFMKDWGALEAMNFDGGGSSEMVVSGKVVNLPSDGRERPVGSALAVVNRKM